MITAVTGATGHLGRLVVERLKQKILADEIVALARNPAKATDLGVLVREADYTKPETLQKALMEVDKLLLISSSEVGQRTIQHQNIIKAAKGAGVRQIVYTSLLHADTSPLNLAEEHRQTETDLKTVDIPHVILRNGWYTENYTDSIGNALAGGAFIGCAGQGRISSAPRIDFADAAVAVLTTGEHIGKVYELAGDDSYTLADLAAEISKQTGREIPYRNLSETEYTAALEGFGLPPELAASIASWDVGASQGALFEDGGQLSRLVGRPTTPFADVVADALKK